MGDNDLFVQLDADDREMLVDLLEGHRNEVLDDEYTGYPEAKSERLDHIGNLLRRLGVE